MWICQTDSYGNCSRQTLQAEIFKARAADPSRPAVAERSWVPRRAVSEEIMIGMLCKELLNLGTVKIDLALEHAQHSHTHQSQATLGTGKGLAGDELGGTRKISIRF